MTIKIIGMLIGGLGLFLLGMRLMTDGLKYAAGKSLRNILANSTKTPLHGILSGAFLTSLVQASSAVSVATIGFVNAGLMDISHAITLIYGSNVGTTMTGWLVSVVGFQFDIKAFALPAIGIGMLLRVIRHESKRGALGDVLAGFGIFFMGIDVLKTTFSGMGADIQLGALADGSLLSLVIFVGIGFLLTLFMQSSSASIAMILTAVAGGVVPLNDAAAVVIGANVGTTSTVALSVIGATPNAKRLAAAHVIFNLVTGLVALLFLSFLLDGLIFFMDLLPLKRTDTTLLALFHTVFNILGVMIMLPLTGRLEGFLKKMFRTREEDESMPRYLDSNVASTPELALHALGMETKRIGAIAHRMAKGAISTARTPGPRLASDREIIEKLVGAVGEFGKLLQRNNLTIELTDQLPVALRISGYYNDVAELAEQAADFQAAVYDMVIEPQLAGEIAQFKSRAVRLLECTDPETGGYSVADCITKLEEFKEDYRALKNNLLRSAGRGQLSVGQMVKCLDLIARIRRIGEQVEKGARYLSYLDLAEHELYHHEKEGLLNGGDPDDGALTIS